MMKDLFGDRGTKMKYNDMIHAETAGPPCVDTASGLSAELEVAQHRSVFRKVTKKAEKMRFTMLDAGEKLNLKVITDASRRVC